MDRRAALPPLGLFLLAVISLGWGAHWPIMKIALSEIPLWQYRSIVCIAAGLIRRLGQIVASLGPASRAVVVPDSNVRPL